MREVVQLLVDIAPPTPDDAAAINFGIGRRPGRVSVVAISSDLQQRQGALF